MQKVILTGPESTGKSTLTRKLAEHFQMPKVEEFAREYLDCLARDYEFEDLKRIGQGQLAFEQAALATQRFLFVDTDLITIKIWSAVKYQKVDDWILSNLYRNQDAIYLLCKPDLPWQPDPQREHPHFRKELFEIYKQELIDLNRKFAIIEGVGEVRFRNALEVVYK